MKYQASDGELLKQFEDLDECECMSCQFPTKELGKFDSHTEYTRGFETEPHFLCNICASTAAGNALSYPSQSERGTIQLLQAIAFAANSVIKAVKETSL